MSIYSISLKNFKSIREAPEIVFGDINLLIGPNGAGKSNLISFFKLLNEIMNQNLQVYVKTTGRANSYLYFGTKKSSFLEGEIKFYNNKKVLSNSYLFNLVPTQDGGFVFNNEGSGYIPDDCETRDWDYKRYTNKGAFESQIPDKEYYKNRNKFLMDFFRNLRVYHFHDTSSTALVKCFCKVQDSEYLRGDASNLAAFLFKLSTSYPKHFNLIEKTIQSVAPFFNRFNLKPTNENQSEINLVWLEKGSDGYFDANHLSDGTLRFICLAALLLQPNPPGTIIIDEPELGLHPSAIEKLSGMIQSASVKSQLIISTQSVNLINNFEANDIIVVERQNDQSVFKRLNNESLESWLEEYSIGDLWAKNVIGGRP